MGDAAGQPADRFHLLGLAELLLQPLDLGDILHGAIEPHHAIFRGIPYRATVEPQPEGPAIFGDDPVLADIGLAGKLASAALAGDRPIFGVNDRCQLLRRPDIFHV